VRLRADLVGESYTWSWNTDVTSQHGTTRSFRQSTFFSSPPSLATRRAETARPETDDRGRAAAAALGLLDGARTLGEVADRLSDAFPAVFGTRPTALRFVADLAETYGVWGPDRGGDAA
jgi:hypothetical protein